MVLGAVEKESTQTLRYFFVAECDPGTAIHSMVERARTKSTPVTKSLEKLAKESIPRLVSPPA
jgi:hypothetical protein